MDGIVGGGIRLYVVDIEAGVAGMGYNLAREHWGKGLTSEAGVAILDYAFQRAGLQKVCSAADARNAASIRVMQKRGMSQEGWFRRQRLHRGEYVDEVHYGILRQDRAVPTR